MSHLLRIEIGIQTVSDGNKNVIIINKIFFLYYKAFPGILNWQKRLWLTIRQFLEHRNKLPEIIPDEELKKHDDYMFDSRNFYIKGAYFHYAFTYQLSVALSKQQGLTNSLRVNFK